VRDGRYRDNKKNPAFLGALGAQLGGGGRRNRDWEIASSNKGEGGKMRNGGEIGATTSDETTSEGKERTEESDGLVGAHSPQSVGERNASITGSTSRKTCKKQQILERTLYTLGKKKVK